MKTIKIGEQEYTLEFTFEAAECKNLIQNMFNLLTGAYMVNGDNAMQAMINGSANMLSEIPHICITAFYAGCLENNPVTEQEARKLLKQYMKENNLTFSNVIKDIQECMKDDGFFRLTGLETMMESFNQPEKKPKTRAQKAKETQISAK
ncbi:MAG: hypothetical protein ACI4EU_03025 [Butyrivibrio sp.]